LNLADGWKTSISEYFAQQGAFPTCSTTLAAGAAGCVSVTGASAGKYVSGITVQNAGQIKIVYAGPQASAKLSAAASNVLTLQPGLSSNQDVVWVCGTAPAPASLTTAPSATATTVSAAYLPTTCHT
jgi:type IV pilus assembly protein PilA